MWHPGWQGMGMGMGANDPYARAQAQASKKAEKVDWGVAAQQWIKNKEMYETWQQQQYQQHMQMMAAQAAQISQSIDPEVIGNPPPPPPPPQAPQLDANQVGESNTNELKPNFNLNAPTPLMQCETPANWQFNPASINKDHDLSVLKLNEETVRSPTTQKAFPAYDKNSMPTENDKFWNQNATDSTYAIDNSKSKLPLWIRDGLASMKKDKQKKQTEPSSSNLKIEKPFNDSDDDSDENEQSPQPTLQSSIKQETIKNDAQQMYTVAAPIKVESTKAIQLKDEEKQAIIVGLVKVWMTEILLDVTNTEMKLIATEVYKKASAQAKPIKKTSALSMIASELSENSESESDEEEDIEFLKKRAEKKLKEYEIKYINSLNSAVAQNTPSVNTALEKTASLEEYNFQIKNEETINSASTNDVKVTVDAVANKSSKKSGKKSTSRSGSEESRSRDTKKSHRSSRDSRSRSKEAKKSKKSKQKKRNSSNSSSRSRSVKRERKAGKRNSRSRSRSSSSRRHSKRSGRSDRRQRSRSRSYKRNRSSNSRSKSNDSRRKTTISKKSKRRSRSRS